MLTELKSVLDPDWFMVVNGITTV